MIQVNELKAIARNIKFGPSYTTNDRANTRALYGAAVDYCNEHSEIVLWSRSTGNLGEIYESILKHIAGLNTRKAYSGAPDITIDGVDYEIKVSPNNHSLASPLHDDHTPVILVTHKGIAILEPAIVRALVNNPMEYLDYVSASSKGVRLKLNAYELGIPFEPFNSVLFG